MVVVYVSYHSQFLSVIGTFAFVVVVPTSRVFVFDQCAHAIVVRVLIFIHLLLVGVIFYFAIVFFYLH